MANLLQAALALGIPLLLAGPVSQFRRAGLMLGGLLAVAYIAGLSVGALHWMDPVFLVQWTALGMPTLLVLLWAVFGALARSAGGLHVPIHPLLGAVLTGAMLGEWAAAALLSSAASEPKKVARLVLAASAGGLLGRMGDPAMLLLFDGDLQHGLSLGALGLLCALVALPGQALPRLNGRRDVTAVAAFTAVGAVALGGMAWVVLLAGCLALVGIMDAPQRRQVSWKYPVQVALLCALAVFATAGGIPELAAEGLEFLQRWLGSALNPVLALAAALSAALLDSVGAAMVAEALLERALGLQVDGARAALAAGCTVGGLGPLIMTGALRAGLLRWAVQVLVVVTWAALLL